MGVLIFGVGRCLGCEWTKTDAEKLEGQEISWDLKADVEAGRRYSYKCPAKGTPGQVVGTDIYLADESAICAAAVHAGAITVEDGGEVTIEVQKRADVKFEGSERNGIKSVNHPSESASKDAGTAADAGADEADSTAPEEKVFVVIKP